MVKWTTTRIAELKGKQRFACLTAYDYTMACRVDAAGIPLILVGDSLGMAMLGYDTTLPVTMEEMVHHTSAVTRAVREALVVADMPFMSYHVSDAQTISNAGRFLKEAGADAVKLEGGAARADTVKRLVSNGIPVLGHIGLTPQSVKAMGGYKVQGRDQEAAKGLIADANALEEAGAFALVLECLPATLGATITEQTGIPTIGIGAGPHCDGQILVSHDMLGLTVGKVAKFVKPYAAVGDTMKTAFETYRDDVESGTFPSDAHSYE